jgi:hypothetical protein
VKCSFCGSKTGKEATAFTTELDYVCVPCAIQFEVSMSFSDDSEYAAYDAYLDGNSTPEFAAKIEAETAYWEAHFSSLQKQLEDKLDGDLFKAYLQLVKGKDS